MAKLKNKWNSYIWVSKVIDTARYQDYETVSNLIQNYKRLYKLKRNDVRVQNLRRKLRVRFDN